MVAITIVRLRNLFAAAMLFGLYSLLSALLFMELDAVDVAFTEAAVGAGVATVLFLAALALTGHSRDLAATRLKPAALLAVVITGIVLVYGVTGLPGFGDGEAPIHQHVAPRYLQQSAQEIGIPNVVTSVLASYRGYDTLGETIVVFTAAVGVLILLKGKRKKVATSSNSKS